MNERVSRAAGVMIMLLAFLTLQAAAQKITIRGHLEQTVEAGGWLIVADTDERTDKYLLLNAKRFQKKSWFHAGAQIEATGMVRTNAVTIYQQGIPFEARSIRKLKIQPLKNAHLKRRALVRQAFGWQSAPKFV